MGIINKDIILLTPVIHKFNYGRHTVTLETGEMARQATSAVMVNMDETTVFVTIVASKSQSQQEKSVKNYFPLTVNYQERTYAAGRFPGGFFRREGRPSEGEILTSRLIDRPIRPLLLTGFCDELQIIATVMSVNPQINPDIIAIIGASTALSLSGIPFNGPIGAARVGYINNNYVLNPTTTELSESNLDLVVSGTRNAILMVESEANLLSDEKMLGAIMFGYEQQQTVINNINDFVIKAGKPKLVLDEISENQLSPEFQEHVTKLAESRLGNAYLILEKKERSTEITKIKTDVLNILKSTHETVDENEINEILKNLEKQLIRKRILNGENRIDGRTSNMIRDLNIKTGILPRAHGSALFTRGETQALVTVTLGTERDAQNIDDLVGERTDRFLLHYNFPPYCVGEIGIVGAPKRREIGHGRLAKRGMLAVMPNANEFPYTIRVVSEITESNGSSSMATVCGASLALMDAGVPIKSAIAGISMGLIKEQNKFVILSDILGDEDYLGDMDLKVAGSRDGISALQMDIKISGITTEIMQAALHQAREARIHLLNIMEQVISTHRNKISEFAPKIFSLKIKPAKIKDIIGKGGSVIRSITEETGTSIEIEDDGTVRVASTDSNKARDAIHRIEEITKEIEVGKIYNGKVTRIENFGVFVSIGGGKEGLVHISQTQITEKHIAKIPDYLQLGQKVLVKVLEIDRKSRVRLSILSIIK